MNWLDIVLLVIFVATIAIQAKRGFGNAMFDFVALLLVIWGISRIEPLWHTAGSPGGGQAAIYAGAFLVAGGLLITIGRFAHQSTLISAYPFDMILGGVFGIGAGAILCYAIVHTLALTGGTEGLPRILSCSMLGKEFVTFDTYHRVLYVLQHFDSTKNPG